jgi:TPR repeat protein
MAYGRLRNRALILATLLVAANAAWADDVKDGDDAFERRDYATAAKLLKPQAERGDMIAELDIGLMYFAGNGLPHDEAEGARWVSAAARQGNSGAQTDIGIFYATGHGVPQDRVRAYMWFSLATAGNSQSAAAYRDHVASELTPDQLREAQAMAEQCKASGFKDCGTP